MASLRASSVLNLEALPRPRATYTPSAPSLVCEYDVIDVPLSFRNDITPYLIASPTT